MTRTILALDFGGTKLSAALFAVDDKPVEKTSRQDAKNAELGNVPSLAFFASWRDLSSDTMLDLRRVITPAGADAAYELAAMVALAGEVLAGRAPDAIGVSFGGPTDHAAGSVRRSDHVRGWEAVPLRDRLAAEFGCPVAVDNDANVAALGEHRFGAGRGVADMMYVTVSTGVGGGWILGGRPWRGHEGMAGEIGHTVADLDDPVTQLAVAQRRLRRRRRQNESAQLLCFGSFSRVRLSAPVRSLQTPRPRWRRRARPSRAPSARRHGARR